jgi:hypothetical protein
LTSVACFVTLFIRAEDGKKGLKETQRVALRVLAEHGATIGETKEGKNSRRVTVHTTFEAKKGETAQKAIDRICAEITKAAGRTAVGRPEGWNPRKASTATDA